MPKRSIRPIFIPIGPSIAYVPLTKGQWALIDRDDAERVGQYNWAISSIKNSSSFYARRWVPVGLNTEQFPRYLHEFILGKITGLTVDHKRPETERDCRKCNLRHANWSQQMRNRGRMRRAKNAHKGISFRPELGKYRVRVTADRGRIQVGHFDSESLAIEARDAALLAEHGEFSRIA
jgi:hypothetical protein